jgi:glycosyltransferase involved in cell wall biosynthesis
MLTTSMTSTPKPKIFFVLGSFKLGGTERTASRVGMELIRKGYPVKFLLINGVFDYDDPLLVNNSIVLSKPGSKPGLLKLLGVFFTLMKIVRRERPDRLMSFSLGVNMLIFFLFYRNTVFRIESNIFIYKKKLYRRYLQDYFSRFVHVRQVVIPSQGLYDASYQYFKRREKLVLISNPLDVENIEALRDESIDDFPSLKNSPFIVSAGRLNASKGYIQLIKIFKQSKLYPAYKLVILGHGELYHKLEELIDAEGLKDHVILGGYQANPYRFMSRARFFVLNSSHESFGNVLIESFACHIPVLSNDCDFGPRHIIKNGVNGLLYLQTKESEFMEKLELMAFNDEIYGRLKKGAVESVTTYHVKTITERWIQEIIDKKL